jgi:hypothetical protein
MQTYIFIPCVYVQPDDVFTGAGVVVRVVVGSVVSLVHSKIDESHESQKHRCIDVCRGRESNGWRGGGYV